MAVRVVFLGAKPIGYHCLEHLLQQQEKLDIRLLGVRTRLRPQFDSRYDLAALARDHGVPLLDSLEELPECDVLYSVQHHELLRREHIAKAGTIAVNLHLAPLPEYRGCNQFSFAIMDEAREFGVTLHEMDHRIDHGDILFEQRFPVSPSCWVDELYDKSVVAARALFAETLPLLLAGHYTKIPQAELLAQRGSAIHYRSEITALKEIDLDMPLAEIEKRVRATAMPGFELPYCLIGGQKVYFSPAPPELR